MPKLARCIRSGQAIELQVRRARKNGVAEARQIQLALELLVARESEFAVESHAHHLVTISLSELGIDIIDEVVPLLVTVGRIVPSQFLATCEGVPRQRMRKQDETDAALLQGPNHFADKIPLRRVTFTAPLVRDIRRMKHRPESVKVCDQHILKPERFNFIRNLFDVHVIGIHINRARSVIRTVPSLHRRTLCRATPNKVNKQTVTHFKRVGIFRFIHISQFFYRRIMPRCTPRAG